MLILWESNTPKSVRTFTTETTVYSFDELSEKSQDKAVERLWDLNVDHEWWDYICDDAKNVGVEITDFDIYRNHIQGKLTLSLPDSANSVIGEHSNGSTRDTAEEYLKAYMAAFQAWQAGQDADSDPYDLTDFSYEDEASEIANDYRLAILGDYLNMLKDAYEYLTGREAIVETILANEYEFTENGCLS